MALPFAMKISDFEFNRLKPFPGLISQRKTRALPVALVPMPVGKSLSSNSFLHAGHWRCPGIANWWSLERLSPMPDPERRFFRDLERSQKFKNYGTLRKQILIIVSI